MFTKHALRMLNVKKYAHTNLVNASEKISSGKIGLGTFAGAGALTGGHLGMLVGLYILSDCMDDPYGAAYRDCAKVMPSCLKLGVGIGAGTGMYAYAFKVAPLITASFSLGICASRVAKSKLNI